MSNGRLITDFQGDVLYLDTTTIYALLRAIHPSVQTLFQRIEQGELRAYTSVLTFDELAYQMLLALIRDHYPGSPLNHLRQQESKMISEFYPQLAPRLEQLQQFPNLYLVDVNAADLTQMDQFVLQYMIRPWDALHLAAMHKHNCLSLVSEDSDFDQVQVIQRFTLA